MVAASSVVVSTAVQEFFGIAVVEAIHAGAFPVLPIASSIGREFRTTPCALSVHVTRPRGSTDRRRPRRSVDATRDHFAAERDDGRIRLAEVAPAYDAWLESF